MYQRISVIFQRSFSFVAGILESFCAIFCNSSCDILIFSYYFRELISCWSILSKKTKSSMALRKKIKKTITSPSERGEVLFHASRAVLSITSLVFFSLLFSISAWFYAQNIMIFFIPSYLGFLVSYIAFLCIATHYFWAKKNISKIFLWSINALWMILWCLFLYPLI